MARLKTIDADLATISFNKGTVLVDAETPTRDGFKRERFFIPMNAYWEFDYYQLAMNDEQTIITHLTDHQSIQKVDGKYGPFYRIKGLRSIQFSSGQNSAFEAERTNGANRAVDVLYLQFADGTAAAIYAPVIYREYSFRPHYADFYFAQFTNGKDEAELQEEEVLVGVPASESAPAPVIARDVGIAIKMESTASMTIHFLMGQGRSIQLSTFMNGGIERNGSTDMGWDDPINTLDNYCSDYDEERDLFIFTVSSLRVTPCVDVYNYGEGYYISVEMCIGDETLIFEYSDVEYIPRPNI